MDKYGNAQYRIFQSLKLPLHRVSLYILRRDDGKSMRSCVHRGRLIVGGTALGYGLVLHSVLDDMLRDTQDGLEPSLADLLGPSKPPLLRLEPPRIRCHIPARMQLIPPKRVLTVSMRPVGEALLESASRNDSRLSSGHDERGEEQVQESLVGRTFTLYGLRPCPLPGFDTVSYTHLTLPTTPYV